MVFFFFYLQKVGVHYLKRKETEKLKQERNEDINWRQEGEKEENYIIIYYNEEITYNSFKNDNRNNVLKIVLDGVEQGLEVQLTIPQGLGLEVYFSEVIESFGKFFSPNDQFAKKIISVDFSHFNWTNLNNMYQLFNDRNLKNLLILNLSNH